MFRVLAVGDESAPLHQLAEEFRKEGRPLTLCRTGAEAVAAVRAARHDAAFIASPLPDTDCRELLKHLRALAPDIYIAVLPVEVSVESLLAILHDGADNIFLPPLDFAQIDLAVQKAREIWGIRRSLRLSEEEILRNFQTSEVINQLLRIVLEDIPLKEKLQRTLDHLLELPWLVFQRRGAIFLADEKRQHLLLTVQNGLAAPLLDACARLPFGRCLCGRAAQGREIVYAAAIDDRHDVGFPGMQPHGHYCVPIVRKDKVLGVLNIYVASDHGRDVGEERFLTAVADTIAFMVEHHQDREATAALQQHLRQSQKMEAVGTLAGGIAHDFNNILTAILGYAALVKDGVAGNGQLRTDVEQIITAGNRARELVRQILTFSRQKERDIQIIQAHLIVKEAMKMLRSSLPTTIDIRSAIATEATTLLAEPTQIHQVVMNLCTNAFHAMREKGGTLTVRLEPVCLIRPSLRLIGRLPVGEYVRLTVTDTGHGMRADVRERIFEPYFTTKGAEDGTGLGLAVVYGIVADMQGDIEVRSEVGKGSTFEIYWPLARQEILARTVQQERLPRGSERILCVDDEAPIVEICQRSLTSLGYHVETRTGSIEALQLFRARPDDFDLVITDQTMPNMTGIELARELHHVRNRLPVILATGYSEFVCETANPDSLIAKVLLKPLLRRDLALAVREVLDAGNKEGKHGTQQGNAADRR
ncbi:MAG: response regulator [Thermodesulfobacteriota bacterium]